MLGLSLLRGSFLNKLIVSLQVRREPSPPIPTLQRKLEQPQCSPRPPTVDTQQSPAPPSVRLKHTPDQPMFNSLMCFLKMNGGVMVKSPAALRITRFEGQRLLSPPAPS